MRFGPVPLAEAEGAFAAHSVRLGGGVIRKGTMLGPPEIARLAEAGMAEVVVARLEPGDLAENVAAALLAQAVSGPHVRAAPADTGRANLYAGVAGLMRAPPEAVGAFNDVDEAITLATLRDFAPVAVGDMVGTVKIIPFAVPAASAHAAARAGAGVLSIAPYRLSRVAVISTLLPGLAPKLVDKTLAVTRARLDPTGARITDARSVPHAPAPLAAALAAVAQAGADLAIVFGASAITDRNDVVPAALAVAGGTVERLGMPVDPGNLILLGRLGAMPVIGAPGCARSPKENGFDFVLHRLLAGLTVTGADIARMGAGGLLSDIAARPHPRAAAVEEGAFAAVILAGGRSARMAAAGGPAVNKLLEEVAGVPVVRRVAQAALASRARPVIVVTGHDAGAVAAALAGLDLTLVHNEAFASGMASSLRAGIGAVPAGAAGALVMLGDMPFVTAALIDRLIAAHDPHGGRLVCVPRHDGRRGHPVLWSRRFFAELCALSGDVGARHLLATHGEVVAEVEATDDGAFLDVDTPELLAAARAAEIRTGPA